MDIFEAYATLHRQGIALLKRSFGEPAPKIAAITGIPEAQARRWRRLANTYFGPTRHTRKQADAIAAAVDNAHSIDTLATIERATTRLDDATAWTLRLELCRTAGTTDEIRALAAQRLEELDPTPAPRKASVRLGRTDRSGMRTITITDTQRRIADLEHTLDALSDDSSDPRNEKLSRAFWNLLDGGERIVEPIYQPVIAIGLKDFDAILRGEGDDVILGCSNGTTMTGAELLNARLADTIYAGLFHPVEGPVNLYRARFASLKQRLLAKAENLVCPWPGCNVPSDRCQTHHLTAHRHGGTTSPTNLAATCGYHNGVNDDDPNAPPKRGRLDRIDGHVQYTSPSGVKSTNRHPLNTLGAMHLI